MELLKGNEIVDILSRKAEEKKEMSLLRLVILGILGGVFIALGYLAYIRVAGTMPEGFRSIGNFIGATVFPIGLIAISLMGAELATGNTLTMTLGYLDRKVSLVNIFFNWVIIAITNIVGAILVAYLFGHIVGLTEGDYLDTVLRVAKSKVDTTYVAMIISGIGANIFVSMAVWIATSVNSMAGKVFGLWFPVMIFIVIGFQHSIANAFIIPAAMFSGESTITIFQFAMNFASVFLGNVIGGAIIVAIPVFMSNRKCNRLGYCEIPYSDK
ncbi:formate/nitrite transporter family protein [Miniphocaeibacter massiliensis]|uniref:formate/nitrite transporter family protein n=1 Tax=Miniphocaeibacter massiliensis TaxID=2041841 RepID=UPI000C1C390C|nr:formate/nitrite transporter family protein [Miniphocaeibacter massiliensis]